MGTAVHTYDSGIALQWYYKTKQKTNLQHHDFSNDFCDGCIEEAAHGFTIDADW